MCNDPFAAFPGGSGDALDSGEPSNHRNIGLANSNPASVHEFNKLIHMSQPQVAHAKVDSVLRHFAMPGEVVEWQGSFQKPQTNLSVNGIESQTLSRTPISQSRIYDNLGIRARLFSTCPQ